MGSAVCSFLFSYAIENAQNNFPVLLERMTNLALFRHADKEGYIGLYFLLRSKEAIGLLLEHACQLVSNGQKDFLQGMLSLLKVKLPERNNGSSIFMCLLDRCPIETIKKLYACAIQLSREQKDNQIVEMLTDVELLNYVNTREIHTFAFLCRKGALSVLFEYAFEPDQGQLLGRLMTPLSQKNEKCLGAQRYALIHFAYNYPDVYGRLFLSEIHLRDPLNNLKLWQFVTSSEALKALIQRVPKAFCNMYEMVACQKSHQKLVRKINKMIIEKDYDNALAFALQAFTEDDIRRVNTCLEKSREKLIHDIGFMGFENVKAKLNSSEYRQNLFSSSEIGVLSKMLCDNQQNDIDRKMVKDQKNLPYLFNLTDSAMALFIDATDQFYSLSEAKARWESIRDLCCPLLQDDCMQSPGFSRIINKLAEKGLILTEVSEQPNNGLRLGR